MDAVQPRDESLADYHAARDAAGLVDRSDLGLVEISGRDRAKFLHALLTNDIAALGPGQGCAAALLDVHGKVQVTLIALAMDDRMLLLTPPVDVDASVLLPEIPAEGFISHTKGCYPGQEVIVRIRDRGHVNRHLRGLLLDGDLVPPPGAEVVADDAVVGQVTSATLSLGLGRPI